MEGQRSNPPRACKYKGMRWDCFAPLAMTLRGDTPILPRKDRQDPPKADCTSFEAPLAPPVLGD